MRIYELTPGGYDRAKSFYGKAKVIEKDGETLLQSYDTTVCKIDKSGEFVRMWGGDTAQRQCAISTHLLKCSAFRAVVKSGGTRSRWRKSPTAARI